MPLLFIQLGSPDIEEENNALLIASIPRFVVDAIVKRPALAALHLPLILTNP